MRTHVSEEVVTQASWAARSSWGDASRLLWPDRSFDIVHQNTVVTSIIDPRPAHCSAIGAAVVDGLIAPGGAGRSEHPLPGNHPEPRPGPIAPIAMSGYDPAVSVVIPCRNEELHIEACVRSMLSQEPTRGGIELIVVDGMSDDGTREVLSRLAREHPPLRVLDNVGRVVSTGLNAAIEAARGQIIIRVDAHTAYAPDYVRECVAVLEETGADNVGGPWSAVGDGYVGRAIAAAFQSPFGSGGARAHNRTYDGPVDTVYLGCWRRSVFERIGGFDEELVRNQDDELNFRLRRAGGTIWQSTRIKSWYRPRNSLRRLFQQYMQYGYWKVRVIQKHRVPASWRHLVPAAFLLTMIVLVCASPFSSLARLGFVLLLGTYLVSATVASLITALSTDWRLLPILPFVFTCFHLGYACGFLRGFWDFVICRRGPAGQMATITRPGVKG